MTKTNKQTASQSNTEQGVTGDEPSVDTNVTALPVAHIGAGPSRSARPNIFNQQAAIVSKQTAMKVATMQESRQLLAEAADLFKEGGDKAEEATKIADRAAVSLYQARIAGAVTGEEVSGALGDVFGYKPKKDGTPGKTPDGQGEAIRKRVVRAVQAADFINTGDGGRFFEGLSPDSVDERGNTIADIVSRLGNNDMSIWTAYQYLADIKRDSMVRTSPAFDPKRIAAMVEALSEEGAAAIFASSPDLVIAYGALIDVLNVVGEQAAMEEAA